MAKSIGATLSLKNGNFFTNIKSAINASNNLKSSLGGSTSGMKGLGSQSTSAGNILTSLASKAAVAVGAFVGVRQAVDFGKDIVDTGMQFEQGMANVSAISGATGGELEALSAKAKEMGANTKFSAIEAADAMSYMGMAGWNSSQMIDGIGGIMNLAAASGEDLAIVSDIVTDSLTAFGLKASDSAQFADVLAVASSKSNTNVSMLGESFKNVAATAGAMGYSMQDTTTALGVMANAGIKGADAGTSLRGVLTRLAKPTKEVDVAMSALGLSAVNADGSMKPLSQLIPEMQNKFAGLTDAEKGQYATMIAGKNALSGFLSLVNSSPDDFASLSDAINNSSGAAQSMADTMNDTVSGKLTLLKSQFEGVKIAIFDALGSSQFKGVLQSMSDGLGAVTPYVTTLTVAIGNGLFSAIQTISGIASTVFNAVKTAIENNGPAIESLKSAFDNVKGSIVNAFSGEGTNLIQTLANVTIPTLCNALSFAMNSAAGVISVLKTFSPVIAGIVGAVTLYKAIVITCTAVEKAEVIVMGLKKAITVSSGAVIAAYTAAHWALSAGYGVATAAQWALNAAMTANPIGVVVVAIGALIAIGVALYKNWDVVKEKALALWNGIKNVFSGIKNTISNVWNSVKEKATAVWGGIKNVVSEKLNNIKSAYDEHGGGLKGAVSAVMTGVKEYYKTGYDAINQMTGGKLGQVVDSVKTKLAPMANAVKGKLSAVKDAFSNAFGNAMEFVKKSYNEGALKPIVDKVVNAFSSVKNAIAEKFSGIKEAIGEKLNAAGDAVGNIKESISGKFSSLKETVAEKFEGIKESVQAKLASITNAVTPIFEGVKTIISTVVDGIKTHISNTIIIIRGTIMKIILGIKQNFQEFFVSVQNAVQGVWGGITTVFEGVKNTIVGVFQFIVGIFTLNTETIKNSIQTIKDGFYTVFSGVQQIVQNVWNVITSTATLAFDNIKTVVSNAIGGVKTIIQSIKDTFSNVFNSVKGTVSNVFNSIKDTIRNVWNGIKSIIKTPHIVKTGTISIAGVSTPIPKLGIQWYANGGIMTRPTAFGLNGNNTMVGGERGAEAIIPLSQLWDNIGNFANKIKSNDENTISKTIEKIEINVYADGKSVDEIVNELVPKLKLAIANM